LTSSISNFNINKASSTLGEVNECWFANISWNYQRIFYPFDNVNGTK